MSAAASTWAPVDLSEVLDGIATGEVSGPTPTLMQRSDGVRLLYGGELHSIAGEPESGKGWLALAETARVIAAGDRVLYIDLEDTAANVVERLLALGAEPDVIAARVVYVQPAERLTPAVLKQLLQGRTFALAIVDGMTEAYALLGLDSYSNTDVPTFLSKLPRPIASATGAAVVLIDHVTKAKEGRGRFAIGAQHKLAGIAVAYGVEVIEPPSRLRPGKLKLTVHKDRHGHVRGHAASGVIALAHIEPADEGATVTVTLEPPDAASHDGEFRPTLLMERASKAIEETPGLTSRELREHIRGANSGAKDTAIQTLAREGYIEIREDGRAKRHYHLAAYRQEDDLPHRAYVPDRASNVPGTSDRNVPSVPSPVGGGTRAHAPNDTGHTANVPGTLLEMGQ
jgi:hypothetical protein